MASIDVSPKQVLRVFIKLEAFKGARDKVIEMLKSSVLDPRKVDIQSHELSWTQQDYDGISNTTMIVIDARQTRTLITPERRDSNVDHWDELKKLQAMSKPPGSVLVVIYGDEHSENLPENQLLANKWENVWKFNDPMAYSLAEKGVCFSLFTSFSETQRQTIRQYMEEVLLFPVAKKESHVLVLGNNEAYGEVVLEIMDKHPFLTKERDNDGNTNDVSAYTIRKYFPITFEFHGEMASPCQTNIYCNIKMPPLKVCTVGATDNVQDDIKRQLSSDSMAKFDVSDIPTPSSSRQFTYRDAAVSFDRLRSCSWQLGYRDTVVSFDRLLLLCHCDKCFVMVYDKRVKITSYVKKELGKLGISLTGDILPVVSEDRAELVQRETSTQMKKFLDHEGDKFREDKSAWFNMLDSRSKLKIYTWHACMTHKTAGNSPITPVNLIVLFRLCQKVFRSKRGKFLIAAIFIVIMLILIIILTSRGNNGRQSGYFTPDFTSPLPHSENYTNASISVRGYQTQFYI